MSSKAKSLLDDTAVSTRAVDQPRSAKRKHIRQRSISTAISRAKAHLAQQTMMGAYPHSGITNQPSEITYGTAVHKQLAAKRKPFWTTQPCRPERYINRDHQSKHPHLAQGTAAPTIKAKHNSQPYINNEQQSENTSVRHSRTDKSGISIVMIKAQGYLPERYINLVQQFAGITGTAVYHP